MHLLHCQNRRLEKALDRLSGHIETQLQRELVSDFVDAAFELDDLETALQRGNHSQTQLQYLQSRVKSLKKSQAKLSKELAQTEKGTFFHSDRLLAQYKK